LGASTFIIFLLSAVNVNVLGYLRVSEIVLIALLPGLLIYLRPHTSSRFETWLFGLLSAYVVGQVAVDFYHGTPITDSAKRAGSMFILLLLFLAVRELLLNYDIRATSGRGSRRWTDHSSRLAGRPPITLLAAHAGWFCAYFLMLLIGNPLNPGFAEVPWRLGLGMATTGSILLAGAAAATLAASPRASSTAKRVGAWATGVSLIAMLPMAGLHLYLEARSFAGITLMVFLIGCARMVLGSKRLLAFDWQLLMGALVAGLVAVLAAPLVLSAAASSGLLPSTVVAKTEGQLEDEGGILVGGRADVFTGLRAVQRRPLLGYGAGNDDPDLRQLCDTRLRSYSEEVCLTGRIPSHSHLVGAWIEAGLVGAVFWTFVLVAGWYVLCRIALWRAPITDLVVFQMLILLWDVVFSPGPIRVDMALKLALIMLCMRILRTHDRRPAVVPRRTASRSAESQGSPRTLSVG
jgi:hypothetical protein